MKKRIKKKAVNFFFYRNGKGSARHLAKRWRAFGHARLKSGYWPRKVR